MPLNRCLPLLIAALFVSPVHASDWPQWRGPQRTGHVPSGEPVPATLPQTPQVLWNIPVGFGIASPIVSGDFVIYIDAQNNKEVVHAVERATGKERWNHILDDVHKDGQSAPGPRCTPMIDAKRIYAQSGRGKLHCLSLDDGKILWQSDYVKDFGATFIGEKGKAEGATRHGYTATPMIDGDHLIVEAGGSPDGSLVCFNKADGTVIWKSKGGTPAYATPMLATIDGIPQIIAFMTDAVIGVSPTDGNVFWRSPVKTSLGRHAATPVIFGNRVVVSSHEAGLIAIDLSHTADQWNAAPAWTEKDLAINFASPVAVGDFLYGVGPNKKLICVKVTTGNAAWIKEGFFTGNPSKSYAGMIVLDKNILTLTDDGQLVLFAADPTAYREISRVRACGKNWCIPAYADGMLYLRDDTTLICLKLM
jgi:outer membrane protein assembly factor BamB